MTAEPVDLQEAGIALEGVAKNPIQTSYIDRIIMSAAQKSLNEGRIKESIDSLKNPGETLRPKEVRDIVTSIFKEDNLDLNHTLTNSPEQTKRKDESANISYAIAELAEKGYDKMNKKGRDLLTELISNFLANHQVFQALAKSKNIQIDSNDFTKLCKEVASNLLRNEAVGKTAANQLVDLLVNQNQDLDYTKLHELLKEKIRLEKSIKDLEDEIGNDGTNGNQKTGLELEVDKKRQELESFKIIIEPGDPPSIKGSGEKAQLKLSAQQDNAAISKTISELNEGIVIIRNYLQSAKKSTLYITDPITNQTIIINSANALTKIDEYNIIITQLEVRKRNNENIIAKIDLEEQEAKQQLIQLEASLKQKKQELKNTQSLLDSKNSEIKKEQDSIKQKEQIFLNGVKNCVVNAVLEEWEESYKKVETIKPEVEKKAETDIQKIVKQEIIDKIWDQAKKVFKTKELDKELESLLKHGITEYGNSYLTILENKANKQNAPPELKQLLPYIEQIRQNPDKLKNFSSEIASYMLKIIATRDPNKLKHKFTKDQIIYAKLTGDVLPDLILQAISDQTISREIEKYVGKELTKKTLREKLAGMDWTKILKILAIVLGLAGAGVATNLFTQIIKP